MGFLSTLDVCASGMTAQWMRMDIASENITNANTTRTENGGPYRRKMVVFESMEQDNNTFRKYMDKEILRQTDRTGGVRVAEIVEDERPGEKVYDPTHPDADAEGYVEMPNVDLLKETVDTMAASRAYDASLTAFNVFKAMAARALDIGK